MNKKEELQSCMGAVSKEVVCSKPFYTTIHKIDKESTTKNINIDLYIRARYRFYGKIYGL